jgi:hypothetical protein
MAMLAVVAVPGYLVRVVVLRLPRPARLVLTVVALAQQV